MHPGFLILFIIIFEPSAHIICYEYSCSGVEKQAIILDSRNPTPNISLCVKGMEQHQADGVKEKQVWKMVWDEKNKNGKGSAEKIAFKGHNFTSFEE